MFYIKVFGFSDLPWYEKYLCTGCLLYGLIGGFIATLVAVGELMDDSDYVS